MWIYFFDITVTHFGDPLAVASVTWRYGILLSAHALLVTMVEVCISMQIRFHRHGPIVILLLSRVDALPSHTDSISPCLGQCRSRRHYNRYICHGCDIGFWYLQGAVPRSLIQYKFDYLGCGELVHYIASQRDKHSSGRFIHNCMSLYTPLVQEGRIRSSEVGGRNVRWTVLF